MSLAQWTEPKPCALSRPRFVKIRIRDERGVPTGETYTKRVGRVECASGLDAVSSHTVNGTVHHLCSECSRDDLLAYLGETDEPCLLPQEYAAPAKAMEGENTMLVRTTPDTRKLRRALGRAGWTVKARTRTVKRTGFLTCELSVWVRPA